MRWSSSVMDDRVKESGLASCPVEDDVLLR